MVLEANNNKNSQLWTEEHEKYVIDILSNSNTNTIKNRQYYHIKSTFKLVQLSGQLKVARIKDNKLMATKSNVFSIISNLHTASGHRGEKKTHRKVSEVYANIPMTCIKNFIEQCDKCSKKMKDSKEIIKKRGYFEIIDLQNLPDHDFNFILNYLDIKTKFIVLKPLKTKTINELADQLLSIFLDFGPPEILESNENRAYTADVIHKLNNLWNDLNLINGVQSYPNLTSNITESIISWISDNNNWSSGLKFIQYKLNNTIDESLSMEPHVALFGQKSTICSLPNGTLEEEINSVSDIMACQTNFDLNNNKDYPVIQTIEVIGVDLLTPVSVSNSNGIIDYSNSLLHNEILLIKGSIT